MAHHAGDPEQLIDLALDDLLLELDRELQPRGFFVDSRGIAERVDSGRNWIQRQKDKLSEKVCSPGTLRNLKRIENSQGMAALVVAVADLIASVVVGVSPFTVAAILIKMGLTGFCGPVVTSKI